MSDNSIRRRDFITGAAASAAGAAMPARAEGGKAPHRYIDAELCINCGRCRPLCPMGAIGVFEEKSRIDPDECAECGVCWRSRVCPKDAIEAGELRWPRVIREVFSNPLAEHEDTGVPGRGTEGIKTNDSREQYGPGEMGVFVELGRPVLGARFTDVEKVVMKFKTRGYDVVEGNPILGLIDDPATGALNPEVLDEKVISAVVEFVMPEGRAGELLTIVRELSNEVDSVFNVCVALRAKGDGASPIDDLFGPDVFRLPNGKLNIGMAGFK